MIVPTHAASGGPESGATRSASTERVIASLRREGPSSQAGLARRTGLSPATVNVVIRELATRGLIEVEAINKRESRVSLATTDGAYLVIEIASDRVVAALFSFTTRERVDAVLDDAGDLDQVVALSVGLLRSVGRDPAGLGGIAVAIQAPVERATGAIATWCNVRMPGWAGVPLRDAFRGAFGVDVVIENDAHLAAYAEWTWGIGRGVDDFFYVRSSRGVGGGAVLGGTIFSGGSGMAGDVGHVSLEGRGEVCYCGSRGCLTMLISEGAILQATRSSPGTRRGLADVIDAARAGDAMCRRVLAESGAFLGQALAHVAKLVGPDVIAIGGELGTAGDLVFDRVRAVVELSSLTVRAPRCLPAELLADPAVLGGLALLLTRAGTGVNRVEDWFSAAGAPQPA